MSKLFQIHEEDLAELERIVPQLGESLMGSLSPCLRTQLRRCKAILSNVRWDYGPPENVQKIEAADETTYDS
jgi:hypothetical protein